MNPFYSKEELLKLGFQSVGKNNQISKLAKFYSAGGSIMGNNNRVDDYCLFKGRVELGNYIHIAGFCFLSGVGGYIKIEDYSGMSSHCSLFTAIEDFISPSLMSPAINEGYSNSIKGDIIIKKAVKIGTHCIILPNLTMGYASSASANTLISRNVDEGAIIGPKSRHFKVYGYRDLNKINEMKANFEK